MFEALTASLLPALLDRAVLAANHVLRAQPQATDRLRRHAGRQVHVAWVAPAGGWARLPQPPDLQLSVTAAGLLEHVDATSVAGDSPALTVRVELPAPHRLVQMSLDGQRPHVEVDGDAQFAADVAWLAENLSWDVEHDLSRALGDTPARMLVQSGTAALEGLRGLARGAASAWDRRPGAGSAAPR